MRRGYHLDIIALYNAFSSEKTVSGFDLSTIS